MHRPHHAENRPNLDRSARFFNQRLAAISRQLAAQSEHARTQDSIPSSSAQLFAHASQASAHTPQTRPWNCEPLVIRSAAVWQSVAQSIIRRTWSGATCLPPTSTQCRVSMPRQASSQRRHKSMQRCMASDGMWEFIVYFPLSTDNCTGPASSSYFCLPSH